MATYVYPAIVEGDEASGYSVYFPDLPGCTSADETQTKAALNASGGLTGHIELMLEDGEPLPAPTPIEKLKGFSDSTEVGRILVVAQLNAQESVPAA